jgi:hypothetical protein
MLMDVSDAPWTVKFVAAGTAASEQSQRETPPPRKQEGSALTQRVVPQEGCDASRAGCDATAALRRGVAPGVQTQQGSPTLMRGGGGLCGPSSSPLVLPSTSLSAMQNEYDQVAPRSRKSVAGVVRERGGAMWGHWAGDCGGLTKGVEV